MQRAETTTVLDGHVVTDVETATEAVTDDETTAIVLVDDAHSADTGDDAEDG